MEEVTIKEIVGVIGTLVVIGGFAKGIFTLYKSLISSKFELIDTKFLQVEKEMESMQNQINLQEKEINTSKIEREVLLKGVLACLKGLHDNLNCNGSVTQGIKDIEEYLISKSHE